GKQPRPSHVKADGKEFDLDKGLYLDGEWVLPGEAINCRCTWSPVIPGIDRK
ncbi:TPA: phage head morphogenesis protein, partial [Escherichia coli]